MLTGLELTLLWCSVLAPAIVLAVRSATDFREPEERTYRRPRAYGAAVFSMAVLAVLSLLTGTVWDNLWAIENRDPDGLAVFRAALLHRAGPAACILMTGVGALIVSAAHRRRGRDGCRGCGYTFDGRTAINITRCPECGAPWRWIGGLRRASSWDPIRLMLGAALVVGAVALAAVLML